MFTSFFDWFVHAPLWVHLVAVASWLGGIGLLAEWLYRHTSAGSEIARKVVHIGAGNVVLFAWWLQIPAWIGIGAAVVFSAIAFLSYKFPILPGINGVGRKSLGTFFYAVSIGVLVGWFWALQQYHHAAIGVLIMTWGDGLAALVGQRFGQHPYKIWGMHKSWEGSSTMFLLSYLVSSLVLLGVYGNNGQVWLIALAIAALATGLEAFSKYGVDNLTVPIGSATASFILTQLLLLE